MYLSAVVAFSFLLSLAPGSLARKRGLRSKQQRSLTPYQPSDPNVIFFHNALHDDTDLLQGNTWGYFSDKQVAGVPNGLPGDIFQSHRSGVSGFSYTIQRPELHIGDTVSISLGFAEVYDGNCKTGNRIFSVDMNGESFVRDLDVFARAGCNTALVLEKEFVLSSKEVQLVFTSSVENPMVSFIQIKTLVNAPTMAPTGTPASLVPMYPDIIFLHDAKDDAPFVHGNTWPYYSSSSVGGNYKGLDARDFQSHRSGQSGFSYTIDSPLLRNGGKYLVRLGFAEVHKRNCVTGERVFSVLLNGKSIVSELDVFDRVGCNTALVFEKEVVLSGSQIEITFVAVRENPMVSVIEVRGQQTIMSSFSPSILPSGGPSSEPTTLPTATPSTFPVSIPTATPTGKGSGAPSEQPSGEPSLNSTAKPSIVPSVGPSVFGSAVPSIGSSQAPSSGPSEVPSILPSALPSIGPSVLPTSQPSSIPSLVPSQQISSEPTGEGSIMPSSTPSSSPSSVPSTTPSMGPSIVPSGSPSVAPSSIVPSVVPSLLPSTSPSSIPSLAPSSLPSVAPSVGPSLLPSSPPSDYFPTPNSIPHGHPSNHPSIVPSSGPSSGPSSSPSFGPTTQPSYAPSRSPYPTLPLRAQEDLVTCVAVIDENNSQNVDTEWARLRRKYPNRPFCLLQPLPTTCVDDLVLPTAFPLSPTLNTYSQVTRGSQDFDESTRSDWFQICNLSQAKQNGLSKVVLFVDDSGSMRVGDVQGALDDFRGNVAAHGMEIVNAVYNSNEDYIDPCADTGLITSSFPSQAPSTSPTALPTMIASPSPSEAPSSSPYPTLPLAQQNDQVTCVSVIDENNSRNVDSHWAAFRSKFPNRPFCVLRPVPAGTSSGLVLPTDYTQSPAFNIFAEVTRNFADSDPSRRSDWFTTCNLAASKQQGLRKVVLFVDNSGSMYTSSVRNAFDYFHEQVEANGMEVVTAVYNSNEDYIDPCFQTDLLPTPSLVPSSSGASIVPSIVPSSGPSLGPSSVPSLAPVVMSSSPSAGPSISPYPTLPLVQQNDLVTCVSVIDENNDKYVDGKWAQLEAKFPFRPFCLLRPLPTTFGGLSIPSTFHSNANNTFSVVTRDSEDVNAATRSDWFDTCDLASARKLGLSKVVLFVDNSGSMYTSSVQNAFDYFHEQVEANGMEVVTAVYNSNENYIDPCFQTDLSPTPSLVPSNSGVSIVPSVVPSLLPSTSPSSIPSLAPSSLPSVAPSVGPSLLPSSPPSDYFPTPK